MDEEAESHQGGQRGALITTRCHWASLQPSSSAGEQVGAGDGGVKQTRHINCTVHVPKRDDRYFTRCSLYNITAETSNFQ